MPTIDNRIETDSFAKVKSMNRATFSQPRLQTIHDVEEIVNDSKILGKNHNKFQNTMRRTAYHSSTLSLNNDRLSKLKYKFNNKGSSNRLISNLGNVIDITKIESNHYPNLKSIAMNRVNKNISKNKIKCVLPTIKISNKKLTIGKKLSTNKWINTNRVEIKVDTKPTGCEEEDSEADLMNLKSKYLEDLDNELNIFDTHFLD